MHEAAQQQQGADYVSSALDGFHIIAGAGIPTWVALLYGNTTAEASTFETAPALAIALSRSRCLPQRVAAQTKRIDAAMLRAPRTA